MNKSKKSRPAIHYDEAMSWAARQLRGVLPSSSEHYFVNVQAMALVYIDCMCMQLEERGVSHPSWPSEWAPYSYSWVL